MKWVTRTISTTFEAGIMPLLFAAALFFSCGSLSAAESAQPSSPEDNSLAEFRAAIETELAQKPQNAALQKQLLEVKSMQRRAEMFARENNPEMAAKLGSVLRRFYYRHQMFAAAEQIDRRLLAMKPDHSRTFALGETLLNSNKNQEAAELLRHCNWREDERTGKLLTALAAARINDPETTRRLLAEIPDERCTPQERLLAVTAAARIGDVQRAAAGVARILKEAPARENDALRKYFSGADFAELLPNPAFQTALQTRSSAKKHDSCAGCPNRGTSRCNDAGKCR